MCKLFLRCHSVLGPLLQARDSRQCACFSSVLGANIIGEVVVRAALKGAMSAQKAVQGSKNETKEL